MIRVLFVCLGNICRSPMAEAVFRDLVIKDQLSDKIEVDSAGIGKWHVGKRPHKGTRAILQNQSIDYTGMKARQVESEDWDRYDYIIAMDDENIADLFSIKMVNDGPVIAKLLDFAEQLDVSNVPDPYFTGDFDYTYELVTNGCENLLATIKSNHKL